MKEVNSTIPTLIPKVKCPSSVTEFRPIVCCNVIYKIITNIICNRMKGVLPEIVAENQGAFIQGRVIAHNILICQDLVKSYGKQNASLGCIIKMDMKKAYDSIDWNFLKEVLSALRFPNKFVRLIMECVSTPRY